jgi:hypothetical protein
MRKIISLMFFAVLAGAFLWQCSKPEEEKDLLYGTISGVVKDATNNEAIAGVNVTLTPTNKSKTTGSDGTFTFTDLEKGEYTLSYTADDYVDGTKSISVIIGEDTKADILLEPITPELKVNPTTLDFGTDQSSLAITISNGGEGELEWTIEESIEWITANETSGKITDQSAAVIITIDRNFLEKGLNSEIFSVTSAYGTQSITVKAQGEGPTIKISPAEDIIINDPEEKKDLFIKNIGEGTLEYTITSTETWAIATPASGQVAAPQQASVKISVDASALDYDTHTAKFIISSNGGNPITLNLTFNYDSGNLPPEAKFEVQEKVNINQDFTVDASTTTDETPSTLEYQWQWEAGGAFSQYSGNTMATHSYATSGMKKIVLRVKDAGGLTDTVSHFITVNKNQAPKANITVDDEIGYVNETFKFTAVVSDQETDESDLEVSWLFEEGGTWTSWKTTKTENYTFTTPAEYSVRMKVRDGQNKETEAQAKVITVKNVDDPTVTTGSFTNETYNAVTIQGNVTNVGGGASKVLAHGFYWKKGTETPSADNNDGEKDLGESTGGAYSYRVTGLTASTTYSYVAFAKNANGNIVYGKPETFGTTKPQPPEIVVTHDVTEETQVTADANGEITNLGIGVTLSDHGFCWSTTNAEPTINDESVSIGAASTTGIFTETIKGLTKGTKYYLRAYIKTSNNEVVYGQSVTFTTKN